MADPSVAYARAESRSTGVSPQTAYRPRGNEPPKGAPDGSYSIQIDGAGNRSKLSPALSAQINQEQATSLQHSQLPFWMNDDLVADVFRRWQDPAQSVMSDEEVTQDEDGLQILMKRGAWKSVMRLSGKLITIAKQPSSKFRFRLCRIISMVKLRMFQAAYSEYADIGKGIDIKNANSPDAAPFSLLFLYAEILYYLGKDPSMDQFYALLEYSSNRLQQLLSHGPQAASSTPRSTSSSIDGALSMDTSVLLADPLSAVERIVGTGFEHVDENSADVWSERENRIIFSIATKLIATREYITALQMLNRIVDKGEAQDATLLSAIGRLYFQLGHVSAGEALFSQIEKYFAQPDSEIVVLLNRGFVAFVKDQFSIAVDSFTKVLQLDPSHMVAANNKALCYLYAGDVSKAIDILEEVLFSDPNTTLHESIVFNLCTMYDLATEKSFDKRKKILQLVRNDAPDSFNLSSLKLPDRPQ